MSYNSQADVFQLKAEWYDTKSNVMLGEFQSQLDMSNVSSNTEELWYIYIYIYIYRERERGISEVPKYFRYFFTILNPNIIKVVWPQT